MFLIFVKSFLTISPEETRAKQPPTPPNGTVASRPTTEIGEPKLALENVAKKTLEPAALQSMIFFCPFVFLSNEAIVVDLFVPKSWLSR